MYSDGLNGDYNCEPNKIFAYAYTLTNNDRFFTIQRSSKKNSPWKEEIICLLHDILNRFLLSLIL